MVRVQCRQQDRLFEGISTVETLQRVRLEACDHAGVVQARGSAVIRR
jgi:hypothetical protein